MMTMFNFNSKTFWLGVAMLIAGVMKLGGLDFPALNEFYPGADGGTLISGGVALIFLRDAVAKVK